MSEQGRLPFDDPPRRRRQAALRSFHTRRQPVGVGEALAGEARAQRQEEAVLAIFREVDQPRLTPSQVLAAWPVVIGRSNVPLLTSIRRALTTMTARGLLVHYPRDRRPGPYGSPESTWGLR